MKFIVTYSFKPDSSRDEAIGRFKKTGGVPPKGIRLVGRWTAADLSHGMCLCESDDAKAMTEFALWWTDCIELRCVPVVDDAELTDVLGRKLTAAA